MDLQVQRFTELGALLQAAASCKEKIFYLAGGTDLMVQRAAGLLPPAVWMDISDIPDLHGIRHSQGRIVIGSGVSHHEIMRSLLLQKYAPALVQASSNVGGPQVRSRGTIGGNLGNGSPAADTVPTLYSLGAEVNIVSIHGERSVKVQDFTLRPRRTVLEPGEIIYSISFPARENMHGVWNAKAQRNSLAISKINIGLSYVLEESKANGVSFSYLGLAFGSVGLTVLRASRTEEFLLAHSLTEAVLKEAAQLASEEVKPISDIRSTAEYRRSMAKVLLYDALSGLLK
ncbi:MAG: FAD binding domain-containing protein [Candidatus Bruticola sp.]